MSNRPERVNPMSLTQILILTGVSAGLGAAWLYRRRTLKRAREPKCPVCRSRDVEGIRGSSPATATLGDDYRCRECGLERADVDEQRAEYLEALEQLQLVEPTLARAGFSWFKLLLRRNSLFSLTRTADENELDLTEVWTTLDRVRNEHPEAFEVPVRGGDGETVAEYLDKKLHESSGTGIQRFDTSLLSRLNVALRGGSVREVVETVRESIAAAAQQ